MGTVQAGIYTFRRKNLVGVSGIQENEVDKELLVRVLIEGVGEVCVFYPEDKRTQAENDHANLKRALEQMAN